ncbi:MAG: hypothetical protein ACI9VS_003006, partial [Candidatus Binatia bacterium]
MTRKFRFRNTAKIAITIVTLSFSVWVSATPDPGQSRSNRSPDETPKGLTASDWSSIRAVYDANRHKANVVEGKPGLWRALNPEQGWQITFDGKGFLTEPGVGSWKWGLDLRSYGFAGVERTLSGKAEVKAGHGRVSYMWGGGLEEWYVNDRRGLEHGYTVVDRPAGFSAGDGEVPLRFEFGIRGELTAEVDADGRGVRFMDAGGVVTVTYLGLKVWDANGHKLEAEFRSSEEGLTLLVAEKGACYPLTIDPIAQQAYLKASNTGADDRFGQSVSVSGDTVAVGAYKEDSASVGVNPGMVGESDDSASNSGAVYVFVRNGVGAWVQQAYLKASNAGSDDGFGYSVSVSGETVVVGAFLEASSAVGVNSGIAGEADGSAGDSGAAYIFVRDGMGTWSQQAYLKASNTGAGDRFGQSVSLSGDTAVVGANSEDSNATGVNPGTSGEADNNKSDSGAAYVFVRDGVGMWSQQAYLKPSNTGGNDRFGWSVSASGDTVVVGAFREDSNAAGVNPGMAGESDNSAGDSGAAYVFVRDGTGMWSQEAYLKASNPEGVDQFGYSAAVSGDTVVVGANAEDSSAVGVNPGVASEANNSAVNSGAAYVFIRDGIGNWSQQAYLKASNTEAGDTFGQSASIFGETLVVGAVFEDSNAVGVNPGGAGELDNLAGDSGAAYVFVRDGVGMWSQQAYLKASNTEELDRFGTSVCVSGDTVVVGAQLEDSLTTGVNSVPVDVAVDSGAAYVFSGFGPPPAPEINVNDGPMVADADIAAGDAAAAFADTFEAGGMTTRTFNVENPGAGALNVVSITETGAHSGDFTIGGALASGGTVASMGSDTFTVTFDPSATGSRTATVVINNNDADEGDYEIDLTGAGLGTAESSGSVSGGDVTLTDENGGSSNDNLILSIVGGNLRINDPNNTLQSGAGASQVDANTIEIPLASITGKIIINGSGGDDTLTI